MKSCRDQRVCQGKRVTVPLAQACRNRWVLESESLLLCPEVAPLGGEELFDAPTQKTKLKEFSLFYKNLYWFYTQSVNITQIFLHSVCPISCLIQELMDADYGGKQVTEF